MGGIITKNNSSNLNKIVLYRADHHNSGKFMTFFTNLSGLICSLNASEHNSDKNLNLYVYECDMNLREMNQHMMSSELPPMNKKYINKQYEFCAKIYNFESSNEETSSEIESEYGDFFVANYNNIKKICKLKKTYNLNFEEFRKTVERNKEYQTALKNITSIEKNNEVFNKLIREGIIKEIENEKEEPVVTKTSSEETVTKTSADGRKSRKSRSRRKSRKSRSRRKLKRKI